MKILVLSDSHSMLRFMRQCVDAVKPDVVIHLGDYLDDGEVIAQENPQIIFYQVPGNCDMYRCSPFLEQTRLVTIGGIRIFMTHGHFTPILSATQGLEIKHSVNSSQTC